MSIVPAAKCFAADNAAFLKFSSLARQVFSVSFFLFSQTAENLHRLLIITPQKLRQRKISKATCSAIKVCRSIQGSGTRNLLNLVPGCSMGKSVFSADTKINRAAEKFSANTVDLHSDTLELNANTCRSVLCCCCFGCETTTQSRAESTRWFGLQLCDMTSALNRKLFTGSPFDPSPHFSSSRSVCSSSYGNFSLARCPNP